MIAVSDITTSAVVAADLYIYIQNLHIIRVLLRDRLHAQPMPDDSWLLLCARCEEDLVLAIMRITLSMAALIHIIALRHIIVRIGYRCRVSQGFGKVFALRNGNVRSKLSKNVHVPLH